MAEQVPPRSASPLAMFRRAAGLTQEELAESSGLSTRGISAIECGRVSRPHRRSLERLANALRLTDRQRSTLMSHYRRYHGTGTPVSDEDPMAAGPDPPGAPLRALPAQLPAAIPGLVGRGGPIGRLDVLLTPSTEVPATGLRLVVVDGAAGVGKSTLVLHWAQRVRARFPDGQLYVNLHGYGPAAPLDARVVLSRFLTALGVAKGEIPTDVESRAGLYRSVLAGRRLLVVLDNARSADQVRPLLPGDSSCAVLVTSRNQLAGLSVRDGAERISLDRLSDSEAVDLLRRFVGGARLTAEPAATTAIVRRCDGLPLALSLVGDLAARARALSDVAGELEATRTRLEVLADEDQASSVRTVFSWSYRTLDAEAARLFRLTALHHGQDLDAPVAAALAGLSVPTTRRLLGVLVGGHLLEQRRPGRYEFHDLLRVYARDLAERQEPPADRRAAINRLLEHYLVRASAAVRALDPGAAGPAGDGAGDAADPAAFPDVAAALSWLDIERSNLLAASELAAAHGDARYACDLSATLWRYLHQAAWHDDAVTLHSGALAAARDLGDPVREARALFAVGTVHQRLGRTSVAVDQLTRAVELASAHGDHITDARASDYLGLIHANLGDAARAVGEHRRALDLYRRADNQEGEATALNNLGLACRRLDRPEEALRHFRAARTITRHIGDRATEGGTTNNIGLILRQLGQHEEALQHFLDALAIAQEIGHREGEGFAASNVGSAYTLLGRYREAAEQQRMALRLAESTRMPAIQASALNQLGYLAQLLGDMSAAAEHYGAAVRVSGTIGARYEQARALTGLGDALHGQGRRQEARQNWREALALYGELGAPEAPAVRRRLAAP